MSVVEVVRIAVFKPSIKASAIDWLEDSDGYQIVVPQLFFDDGTPFQELNRYAIEYRKSNPREKQFKTIVTKFTHLKKYVDFLEANDLSWLHFPRRAYESVLFKFRVFLIDLRDEGILSASTANSCMNAVVNFYKWAKLNGVVSSSAFNDSPIKLSFFTETGFKRARIQLRSATLVNIKQPMPFL